MHKVCRNLGLRQNIVEQISSLWQEVAMIRARVVPGKHGMPALILALKELEIKVEDIPVHLHHKQTATKNPKDKG